MLRKHKRLTRKELKQDPLVIFAAQTFDYLRTEWIKIVSCVVGVALVISVTYFVVQGKKKSEINAFDLALTALSSNAPEALDLMDTYVAKYSKSKNAPWMLLQLGNHYFAEKDYIMAEKYYLTFVDGSNNNQVFDFNAYNGLGAVYEETGDFIKAGEIYEKYASRYRNSAFTSMMYLNAGKAYVLAGRAEDALRNFNKIIQQYGDSTEKQEALFYSEMLNTSS